MGITVGPITTPQGFQVDALYLHVVTFRILSMTPTKSYHCIFSYEGYKSFEDKQNRNSPLSIPESLRQAETIVDSLEFLRRDIFEIAYATIKSRIAGEGYTITDIQEPNQQKGSSYRFNKELYDVDGFNPDGFDKDGYDKDGLNAQGYDKDGYDRDGYNAEGYNHQGFDRNGYDKDGYDIYGYNQAGVDRDGNPRPTMPQ
jgi:hypothetical protein